MEIPTHLDTLLELFVVKKSTFLLALVFLVTVQRRMPSNSVDNDVPVRIPTEAVDAIKGGDCII